MQISTGVTLRENNLKEIEGGKILQSEGVLVANRAALKRDSRLLKVVHELIERFEVPLPPPLSQGANILPCFQFSRCKSFHTTIRPAARIFLSGKNCSNAMYLLRGLMTQAHLKANKYYSVTANMRGTSMEEVAAKICEHPVLKGLQVLLLHLRSWTASFLAHWARAGFSNRLCQKYQHRNTLKYKWCMIEIRNSI